jgi:monoamine oxidase
MVTWTISRLPIASAAGYVTQMKFIVAGGGVAGLATSLALARAGHQVVVLERDRVHPG